jgi:hypothetical protein
VLEDDQIQDVYEISDGLSHGIVDGVGQKLLLSCVDDVP